MRYIEPSFSEIKKQSYFDFVALVGHNCYQVDRTSDNEAFVKRLITNRHLAMVEHYNFGAEISKSYYDELVRCNSRFLVLVSHLDRYYVSFSLRELLEVYDRSKDSPILNLIAILPVELQNMFEVKYHLDDAKLLSEEEIDNLPKEVYEKLKYVTLRLVTDRGVTHEIVRHRICSFAQESTRYCNYSKNKFGNELTFIKPLDYEGNEKEYDSIFSECEKSYLNLISKGVVPEFARSVLPNKLKATIIVTCNIAEWKVIFELRGSERAHPDMRQLILPIIEYFKKEGYLK